MTIRDFFRLTIKLFCVYCLVNVSFYYIPQNALSLVYSSSIAWGLAYLGILIIFSAMLYLFLTKKIDNIIDWLKLDKGFDQNIIQIGNFNERKIISIAILIIGGMMIVDYLPIILSHVYSIIRELARGSNVKNLLGIEERVNYFDFRISVTNIILGYLMIKNHSFISKKLANPTLENTSVLEK